ncbi:MAG: hypothetical protein M5U26_06555 [Planctomycetota bacterium]|nr:hypothetical protein [Planctomycetota bacterium]
MNLSRLVLRASLGITWDELLAAACAGLHQARAPYLLRIGLVRLLRPAWPARRISPQLIPGLALSAALAVLALGQAFALEGALPEAVKAKMLSKPLNFGLAGSPAKDYVKTFNEQQGGKVAIEAALAKKTLALDFGGKSLFAGVDELAAKLGAKAYAIRDFVYIGAKLPPGLGPSTGDGKLSGYPAALATLPAEFPGIRPGTYRCFPWLSRNPQELKGEGKPVLMYIYDIALADNNPLALYYETAVFEDPKFQEAVKERFCFTLLKTDDTSWPAEFLTGAKDGAAVFVLTGEMKMIGSWNTKTPRPPMDAVLAACQRAMQQTKPAAKTTAAAKTEDEEPGAKTGIAGLLDGPKEGEKTPAATPRPAKKTEAVEEEE